MAQGLGGGSRHRPEGCVILGAPPTGQDRLGKPPWVATEPGPVCSGHRCWAEPFPAVLGAGSLQGWAEPWALCAHVGVCL